MSTDPHAASIDACPSGICGADVPPLVGSVLTGTGLTLAQAARALEQGRDVALTDVQRAIVERWAEQRLGSAAA